MATFYFNKSDKRYANKTLEVVYDNVDLTYIDKTDIANPVIKLGKAMDPLAYNYVYIPEFNRYYFLTEPPIFEAGYYRVKLHTDVLMTFKAYYKQLNVIVKRQENKFNMYLEDSKYNILSSNSVRTVQFPSGFTGLSLVMGVVGKNSSST